MIVRAYAKINLSLEVLGRRDDGYHEIVTVLQRISLHDDLSFELARTVTLACDRTDIAGDQNLVVQAALQLREHSGTPLGVAIRLTKRIPIAAGLGGGSADAAATLLGLNRLWKLHLTERRLLELAAALGSDVPFFFFSSTALAEGRGERVRALPSPRTHWVVLVVPKLAIAGKTRRLYGALGVEDYSDGKSARLIATALETGRPLDRVLLVNSFERIALHEFPAVRACRDTLLDAGAPWARLSGSGPALYTLLQDEQSARAIHGRLRSALPPEGADLYVTTTEE